MMRALFGRLRRERYFRDLTPDDFVRKATTFLATLNAIHPFRDGNGRTQLAAVRIVDMSPSNSWAELAGVFCQTRAAFLDHEQAKMELKILMPEDAKEAFGHGIRAKRSKSGAISFDLLSTVETSYAPVQ
jgi:Fic/DOC family